MKSTTLDQAQAALKNLPIQPGDGLIIHSAVQFLGKPIPGPEIYLEALLERVGSAGTIAVPTFNFDFCKGSPFDRNSTPSKGMGVFSELVRQHPDSCRTTHPMQSCAVLGRFARDLCERDTPGAFDDNSAFDHMLELEFKLLLLGAPVQSVSMVHYVEQRQDVPYRYWKDFPGEIREGERSCQAIYRMFVRDEAIQPELMLKPIQEQLQLEDRWTEIPLNYGKLAVCSLRDFVSAAAHLLRKDPWALIKNPPRGDNS